MAHMKMIFYPMLLLSIYLLISRRDIREVGAPILGSLAVMPVVIVSFFAYWIFVRHELMAVDMIIYISVIMGAVHLTKRWMHNRFIREWWPLWIILAVIVIVFTGYLTYNSPDWIIFADLG